MVDPSKEIFDSYLKNYERRGGERQFRSFEEVRELHLERLPRWIDRVSKDARILDAGCATGYMLSLLHNLGYVHLEGVDISEQLIVAARERLPATINLTKSDIRDFLAQTPDGVFDIILFHHVLEHVPREHTIELLREFRRVLVPGGSLSIRVPNAACLAGGWQAFGDFTHVVYFNEISMRQILEQAGFDVDHVKFILHPPRIFWSWRHPLRAILRLFNRARWVMQWVIHRLIIMLVDFHPEPRVFELELDVLARK